METIFFSLQMLYTIASIFMESPGYVIF